MQQTDDELIKKRALELARRAFRRGIYTSTEFLTLAEQDVLLGMAWDGSCAPMTLTGGFPSAERRLALFGDEACCGYAGTAPIACVALRPASRKFAEALSHRDVLGALMGLGIRRSLLGDILLREETAYIFCLESAAGLLAEGCTQVRHTTVRGEVLPELPAFAQEKPEKSQVVAASARLDALVAAVYRLSRREGQELIHQGRVFVNSRLTENGARVLEPGALVSVRGYGRFLYEGEASQTHKGRLRAWVRIY